jgi:hypothetical protein
VSNSKDTSLYDFMETNEEMVLLVVKEQLNHYWILRRVDEWKEIFTLWKVCQL